jgi:LmbE family N-acetylglucosaminyl deacetylase
VSSVSSGNGPRFAARPIATGGTPTTDWTGWRREFPDLNLDDCPALVVVAPHPDDETLGFGATAATLRSRGVDVQVVSVTDGDGAFPELSRRERDWLASDRRAELRRAAEILGLGSPIHLGLPDGELSGMEPELTTRLTEFLEARPPGTWCAATWRGDGHPDHESVGRAAAAATERTGAELLEYPVWMWHWAEPDDAAVPWERMSRVRLDRVATARKQRAANVFRTQLVPREPGAEAVLPPFVMRRLLAVGEVVFRR